MVEQVRAAAALIRKAQRPVFLLGSQAVLPPMDVNALRATLERLGIPCYLGGMSRGGCDLTRVLFVFSWSRFLCCELVPVD
jgi:thiamine pyrophosphate-dependent acetolactate synthase large subunit-like protein